MKKPYRNALRSRQMIQSAFIELLAEKPIEQITVVDIVKRSDLSRNTFYAHYQDVYAVMEEYQQKGIEMMQSLLNEAVANQAFDNPLPILQKVAEHVVTYQNVYRVLLNAGQGAAFSASVKHMLIECIIENMDTVGIRDRQGLLVFMDVLATGFLNLFQVYLRGESSLTPDDIVQEISKIHNACISIYK